MESMVSEAKAARACADVAPARFWAKKNIFGHAFRVTGNSDWFHGIVRNLEGCAVSPIYSRVARFKPVDALEVAQAAL
jgi:hypothetical protein